VLQVLPIRHVVASVVNLLYIFLLLPVPLVCHIVSIVVGLLYCFCCCLFITLFLLLLICCVFDLL